MASTALRRFQIVFGGVLILVLIVGCSGGRKAPRTQQVSGKIIYKNNPVAKAQVGFVSKFDNKDVIAAHGETNDNGEFTLSTYIDPKREVSGATPGDFIVTVSKVDKIDPQQVLANFSKNNPTFEGVLKKLIPAKYQDAKQTPLTAQVTEAGPNRFEFKLED